MLFPIVPGDGEERGDQTASIPFGTLAEAIQKGLYDKKELEHGEKIHHYRILERLAMGGMGVIYVAEHVYLKQQVALKTLKVLDDSGELAERFLREAQALAILNGPNVLKVQDASVFENIPYVVTELLCGQTLSHHLEEYGPLTINQGMDLLEQIGDVLIR